MPNWAMGQVTVTGKRENIVSFVERFVSDDVPSTIPGKKFFARSFLNDCHENVLMYMTEPDDPAEDCELTFHVSFAWSAYSCIISGYPERNPDECITLIDACVEDRVNVHIQTYELGMCFEEDITCTADGDLTDTEKDLSRAKCPHCGAFQSVGSFDDLDDLECDECGELGLVRCSEDDEEDE